MRKYLALGMIGITLITLEACTTIPPVSDIPAVIANASTPADHRKIADYFAEKAASYDAEVAFHEKMARSYFSHPKGDPSAWIAHCNKLKQKFAEAAQEARALERAHRQLADKQ